ncbi:hypothetical protein [Paucilactobacillus nenjiangensis]|jgi:hypothetical protein|uniref:hypothetical protein n=1 Tax=Paucilactobacillus nenjiangensis TaxID=1296540 RepID=UPI003BAFDA10
MEREATMKMHKFTTKELLLIQSDHDVFNCKVVGCETCKGFYAYRMKFRTQTEIIERAELGRSVSGIAKSVGVSEDYVQRTVIAVKGMPISAIQTLNYQERLNKYVNDGLSVVAIARRLKKPVTTVRSYMNHNSINTPDCHSVKIDVVKSVSGDVRYFDSRGSELSITYKRNGKLYQ